MRVYIFGVAGNMARRYRAILEHLGHTWSGEDPRYYNDEGFSLLEAQAFIIATPTESHAGIIRRIKDLGVPILCEKPITRDLAELRQLMADCVLAGTKIQMVSQYDYLVKPTDKGATVYDYYKTGPDGLPWDALQIIWHAKDTPDLHDKSPIWRCWINGRELSIREMDWAYVQMINDWLESPRNDISRILESHEKVTRLEASWPRP